jgi:death-on-curing protein
VPRVYPTVAEVVEAHRLVIQETGGLDGILDRGAIESAVLRPQCGYYQNIIEEAAALMESLASPLCFTDGNKRTSFVMTDAMLRANGYMLKVDPIEAHDFITESIDKGTFRFPQICAWLTSIIVVDEL